MRLVFFIDNGPKIGGGAYAQYMFARQLAENGHRVTIFAGDRTFISPDLEIDNLTVFYRKSVRSERISIALWDIHERLIIEPWLKKHGADWLIGYMRKSSIRATRLGEKYKIPVANFVFETPDWIHRDLGRKIEGRYKDVWEQTRTAYDRSNILIPNSQLAGDELLKWLPTAKVSMPVYPGVDIPEASVNGIERDIDIVYVGRLAPHKNIDIILRNARPEHRIAIMGSGSDLERLEGIANERNLNVDFMGSVSDEDKWDVLRRSKLMVFPSKFEGFGMPPLEALACRCHILCSDIPVFKEIYGDAVTYFELASPEISGEIDKLLATPAPDDLPQLVSRYTWQNAADRIIKILEISDN